MSPRRSSGRTQQPAQRRPRTERACNFCRIARQRCEPIEYGTNDRPCRRCVSQGLDCNLPRAARSQSPSATTLGVQSPAPIRHHVTPHSAGGATEEPTPSSEATVQYMLPQSEPVRVPMEGWSPLATRSEGGQGSSTTSVMPGQTPLQATGFLARASSMEGYQQSFSNLIAQGCTDPGYYSQNYYEQITSSHAYMTGYATGSGTNDASNLGYVMDEPQPHNTGAFADEQDASLSCSDDQPHGTGAFADEQDASLSRPDES